MSAADVSSVTVGQVISAARARGGVDVPAGLSVRELARRAGVSAAQVSRIESGQVSRPSREILVAIARALNRNPLPLIILAGHLDAREAQDALAPLFRDDAELPQEWGEWARYDLATVRHMLSRVDPQETEPFRIIAADVFRVEETDETLWDDVYLQTMARGEQAAEVQELMAIWRAIGERRQQLLAYGRSLRELADLEFRAAAEADRLAADQESAAVPTRKRKIKETNSK